jgi:hemerythrin-like domain-containing protein
MNAIELLEKDHTKVRRLLKELDSTTDQAIRTREELFGTIRSELDAHETIEEEIFYPALKQHPKAKDNVLEAYEEHHVADLIVNELGALAVDEESWGAKASVLKESVEHHIEEEEGKMFKKARQVFDADELDELGTKMAERKLELTGAKHI